MIYGLLRILPRSSPIWFGMAYGLFFLIARSYDYTIHMYYITVENR